MGLLRYQIFLVYGIAFVSVWYYALQRKDEIVRAAGDTVFVGGMISPKLLVILVDWAPLFAVLALGLYAFLLLVIGVIKFRDCPEAAAELEVQVAQAKKELKKKGIVS